VSRHGVKIVVAEGQADRKGLLRFVLEGDGHEVAGQASSAAELGPLVTEHAPDVVVLDDGIGVSAVQLVRQLAPSTKIVLVWPGAVVPIGGDARVDPGEVLGQLGPTVSRVTAAVAAPHGLQRPDWVEKVRKDPATLRDRLAERGGVPVGMAVTELQARFRPVEPDDPVASDEPPSDEPGQVIPLPISAGATALAAADDAETIADNRRVGLMALGGAAAIGVLALSLALAGGRVPAHVVLASGFADLGRPPIVAPPIPPYEPPPIVEPGDPNGPEPNGPPVMYPPDPRAPEPADNVDDPGPGPGNDPGPKPDPGPGPGPGPGQGPEPDPDPATSARFELAPGNSALHNPHGGPPGQLTTVGNHTEPLYADGVPGHAGEHGNGNGGPKATRAGRHTHKR